VWIAVSATSAATTAVPALVPADVGLGVAVSLCRQVSPARLVVARARRGRGPARTSCDRSGPPSCRSVGTSSGWTPHRRQGPGRSSAPGSPSLFTLPQLCSISTRCADWPSTISQTMWDAMPLGMSAGRSPRRSHRILDLQPRSCSWRSISRAPRSADCPAPVLARRASPGRRPDRSGGSAPASAGPVAPATRSSHRSWVLLALGNSSPATACAGSPTCTLTRLTTRSGSVSSHRCCLGPPPAPCRAAPAPRGSGVSAGQLLPILGVSRVAGCGNRYLPRSSPSLSLPWSSTATA
jgi:hypothetical protein